MRNSEKASQGPAGFLLTMQRSQAAFAVSELHRPRSSDPGKRCRAPQSKPSLRCFEFHAVQRQIPGGPYALLYGLHQRSSTCGKHSRLRGVDGETAYGHLQTCVAEEARGEGIRPALRGHRCQFRNADAAVENKASSRAVVTRRQQWEADHSDRVWRKERLWVRT